MFALPAGFSLPMLMAWLLAVQLVKRLADTFYNVPYLALGAEVSSDYEERPWSRRIGLCSSTSVVLHQAEFCCSSF